MSLRLPRWAWPALLWVTMPSVVLAEEETVGVRVVEVAGENAYLSAGREQGLQRDTRVRFQGGIFRVVRVSANNAAIARRAGRPRLGARGRAQISRGGVGESGVKRLEKPAPLASYAGRWPGAVLPASTQNPEPVPLGRIRAHTPSSVYIALASAGILPLDGDSGAIGRAQLRAKVKAVPFADVPFSLTTDLTLAGWAGGGLAGRPGNSARSILFVREFAARYGRPDTFAAALGRLSYAAASLGMLDGARVSAPLASGLRVSAFGGVLPNPLSGAPLFDASRFGAELLYEDLASELRPRLALTGHGSHFAGALDERQLQASADFFPSFGRFGGHVAMRLLDEDNPWNAPTTQVYAAGGHAHFFIGAAELGGRVDMYRPERSRFLASYLPPTFFCAPRDGQQGVEDGGCYGDEMYITGQLDARYTGERTMFSLGATADATRHLFSQQLGGYAHLRVQRILGGLRFDMMGSYRHGSLLRGARVRTALGYATASGELDMSLYYQPAYLSYRADIENYLEHGVGADIWFKAVAELDVVLTADLLTGRDVDMVMVQAQLHYRPSL